MYQLFEFGTMQVCEETAPFFPNLFSPKWMMKYPAIAFIIGALILGGFLHTAVSANEAESEGFGLSDLATPGGRDLLPRPTVTGAWLWSDLVWFRDYRIQCHAVTGEHRLLDPRGFRRAWGTLVQCRDELNRIKKVEELEPLSGRAVVVLHGLLHSPGTMEGLCDYIEENSDFTAVNVGYPSNLLKIEVHARYLAHLMDELEGFEEIDFVAHSMGNIVFRHYLKDRTDPETGRQGDPRIKRCVMLAPPNNGSVTASVLARNDFFITLFGRPGQELGVDWNHLAPQLAVPSFEFGVIAGGRNDERGYNPVLAGDDDGTVRVEGTKLPGMTDFRVVPSLHTFIMDHPKTRRYTLQFLETGYFESPDTKQPLPDHGSPRDESRE